MSFDPFACLADNPGAPSLDPRAITPSDTLALPVVPKALYIGTGGTLVVRTERGSADVTFKNLASGQILPVRPEFIRQTGTTATDIVALA